MLQEIVVCKELILATVLFPPTLRSGKFPNRCINARLRMRHSVDTFILDFLEIMKRKLHDFKKVNDEYLQQQYIKHICSKLSDVEFKI